MRERHENLDPQTGAAFVDDDREREVHADFGQAVVVDTERMEWQPSPAAGVWRKRLELIGRDNPRLTSIVRFEPGSRFDEHGHPCGEEFLVLSGTFSDHSGDFSAGTYVRNPAGWVHAPWTNEGCELFVKLCQFQPDDRERLVLDTRTDDWQQTGHPALSVLQMYSRGEESVSLYQLAAGADRVAMNYPEGAELLLVEGGLDDGKRIYPEGSWLRLPAESRQGLRSRTGCRFYCKRGGQSL